MILATVRKSEATKKIEFKWKSAEKESKPREGEKKSAPHEWLGAARLTGDVRGRVTLTPNVETYFPRLMRI